MKCKECKEKIPDNVKYCPECGALISNKNYTVSIPYTKNNTSSAAPSDTQSSDTKKLPKHPKIEQKTKARILMVVFFALIFGLFSFSVIDEIADAPDAEFLYENPYNIDNVESAVYSYVDNLLTSKDSPGYDTFNYTTTIDWDEFFADVYLPDDDDADGYVIAESEYHNLIKTAEFLNISDTEYSYVHTNIENTTKFAYNQIYSYMDIFNSLMNPLGLSSVHYVPYSDVNNMFEAKVCIDFCDEYDNIVQSEYMTVTVVQCNGFYDVLYDDVFIRTLIESQYEEITSSEPDSYISEYT